MSFWGLTDSPMIFSHLASFSHSTLLISSILNLNGEIQNRTVQDLKGADFFSLLHSIEQSRGREKFHLIHAW